MAKFILDLDTRTKKKNDLYNLTVRMVNGKDVMFLKIVPMTKKQYDVVFVKKSMDPKSLAFREDCNTFLSKCERIFSELKPFNKDKFRELVYGEDKVVPDDLKLKYLFSKYIETNENIKLKTKIQYKLTMNVLESLKSGITVWDVTPELLKKFEKGKTDGGCSPATSASYLRHLRAIINYYTKVERLIPDQYVYPFGKGSYSIKNYYGKKLVLSNAEIKKVADLDDFENKTQEFARDMWLFLYRCNGINMADLFRMKWTNIKGDYFSFLRMKTETTRKNNIQEITVPITPKLQELIDKLGVKDSPFILGYLREGYSDFTFENKIRKVKKAINKDLGVISEKLNLSVELKLMTARASYATTLKRAGKSTDEISEMLGHSNTIVTQRYLASLDMEKTFEINECLY